jgi:hypothetical protein
MGGELACTKSATYKGPCFSELRIQACFLLASSGDSMLKENIMCVDHEEAKRYGRNPFAQIATVAPSYKILTVL